MRIGLISDTHGLLRPEAEAFLEGCDRIVHAGDVGAAAILDRLGSIAPLTVVRGNNDTADWADALATTQVLRVPSRDPAKPELGVYVIHDIAELAIDPGEIGVQVVVSGHSHKPGIRERGGILYVNPGSAGPRRFKLPISVGELLIVESSIVPRLTALQCR